MSSEIKNDGVAVFDIGVFGEIAKRGYDVCAEGDGCFVSVAMIPWTKESLDSLLAYANDFNKALFHC